MHALDREIDISPRSPVLCPGGKENSLSLKFCRLWTDLFS